MRLIWIESGTAEDPILCVAKKGKSLVFTNESTNPYAEKVYFKLSKDQFDTFYSNLFQMAKEVWGDIELKDVTGLGNDYDEYYDKELDNEGGAKIDSNGIYFFPPAPHLESNRLYRFTKTKIQTYLYDLKKQTSFDKESGANE